MTISEKVAFLKGLMEGLDVDASSKEGKLFHAILDTLEEIALTVDSQDTAIDELTKTIEDIDDDLDALETEVYGDDDFDDFEDYGEDEDELYEVTCPSCGDTFKVSEDMLDDGETTCPACGQTLEFDLQIDQDSDKDENNQPIQF